MKFYMTLIVLAMAEAAMAAPTVIADTSVGSLVGRAEAVTISNVNSCAPDDPPVCEQEPYVHFGAGTGSCSDKTAPFNSNFCSTFGTIPTPAGSATWHKAGSCSESAKDGTAMGTLTAGKTVYHCVKATGKSSNDCGGITYVGDVIMHCTT